MIKWILGIVAALIVSGIVGAAGHTIATAERVSALETKVQTAADQRKEDIERISKTLERIERKLDLLRGLR